MPPTKFHPIRTDMPKPRRFTFPFCYEPNELCRIAARELVSYVESVKDWQSEMACGKMLGVLVVEAAEGLLGYLAAFSGLLQGRNDHAFFVPPVFDATAPNGYFKVNERRISAISHEVEALLQSAEYASACQEADCATAEAKQSEREYRETMRQAKLHRDEIRQRNEDITPDVEAQLIRESQHMKAELRRLRQRNAKLATETERRKQALEDRINALKRQRRQMSDALQQWLFSQYNMLNAHGEVKPLTEIFAQTPQKTPPAGAGDCCAPKLLQYAYLNNMKPVCMAELWYGASPASEVRHHLHYYPACRGKCLPILAWMLQGLNVEPDPQLRGCTEPLEVIWADEAIIVVNKPAGMLTVPGRSKRESVLALLREKCPNMTGSVIVHRLDMDTSGLIVAAKTAEAHRNLQQQFLLRTVKKRYTAILDGTVSSRAGNICLPLSSDPLDRPYQKVNFLHGKPSFTTYRVLKSTCSSTLIELSPHTGRTHQLRVHCASPLGLNAPICGDRLYGHPASRLFLHASMLSFMHPLTGEWLTFERHAPFTL